MSNNRVFWRIEIEYQMKFHHTLVIPGSQISDKKIENLLEILIAKYMLTDEEIISSLCKKTTHRYHHYLDYQRHQKFIAPGKVRITYLAQISSMSVSIMTVYQEELTQSEKEMVRTSSTIKL